MASVKAIELTKIVAGQNPREEMGDIVGLADSIRDRGLLQPIRVKRGRTGLYQIITGHRRFEAHRLLGRETIDAIVVEEEEESDSALNRIVENLQREDLRPLELAKGIEALSRSFHKSDEEIARSLGKSSGVIKQWRLLSRLPDEVLARIGTAESAAVGDTVVTPRHLSRILPHIPAADDGSERAQHARRERIESVEEFVQRVHEVGGINAHQADAAWAMVLRGEADVEEAVKSVAENPDAYRYRKTSDRPLPPPITSGEGLEVETYNYLVNVAASVRARIADVRPEIVSRLDERHRENLIPVWEQLQGMVVGVVHALHNGAVRRTPAPKRLQRGKS